jgi:hypothetical protein
MPVDMREWLPEDDLAFVVLMGLFLVSVVGATNGKSPNSRRLSRRLRIEGTIQL